MSLESADFPLPSVPSLMDVTEPQHQTCTSDQTVALRRPK